MFSMLACFVSSCAHMAYMIAVLKYLTCLRACVLLWHYLSYFLCICKVNFQKFLYRKILFYSKKYLEPTWTSSFLQKKAFHYFRKKAKKHRLVKSLFPTVNKRSHKPFFWQHPLVRIFVNILYYLNSHNHKKRTFFSCNYLLFLSVCLESFIQVISIDNSNKFINIMS